MFFIFTFFVFLLRFIMSLHISCFQDTLLSNFNNYTKQYNGIKPVLNYDFTDFLIFCNERKCCNLNILRVFYEDSVVDFNVIWKYPFFIKKFFFNEAQFLKGIVLVIYFKNFFLTVLYLLESC